MLVSHQPVALAARGFEARSILDHDPASSLADETGSLKRTQDQSDGRSPDAEDGCELFVSQRNLAACNEIIHCQQPPNASPFDLVKRVAHGQLHASNEQDVHEPFNHAVNRHIRKELASQRVGTDSPCGTGDQHRCIVCRPRDAGKERGPYDAVTTDQPDLQGLARFEPSDKGYHRRVGEVHSREGFLRAEEHLLPFELDAVEVRRKP